LMHALDRSDSRHCMLLANQQIIQVLHQKPAAHPAGRQQHSSNSTLWCCHRAQSTQLPADLAPDGVQCSCNRYY
jgi:hypothetical protein